MNLDDYLRELFYVRPEDSQMIGFVYFYMMRDHEMVKHPEIEYYLNYSINHKRFKLINDTYWQKIHRENNDDLINSLAQAAGYTTEDMPLNLLENYNKRILQNKSLFANRQTKDTNEDKYYFEVIFEPKYQHIRQELIKIHSQFEQIDDSLMRDFIVATIRDYQGGFPDVLFRYKELPSFLECILFHGLCKVHQNEIRRLLNINNEEQKIILYSIFIDFFGEKKLVA